MRKMPLALAVVAPSRWLACAARLVREAGAEDRHRLHVVGVHRPGAARAVREGDRAEGRARRLREHRDHDVQDRERRGPLRRGRGVRPRGAHAVGQGHLPRARSGRIPNAKNVMARFRTPAYDPEEKLEPAVPVGHDGSRVPHRQAARTSSPRGWPCSIPPAAGPRRAARFDARPRGRGADREGVLSQHPQRGRARRRGRPARLARSKRLVGFSGSPDSVGKVLAGDAWIGVAYNGDAVSHLDDATDFAVPGRGHDHLGRRDDHPGQGAQPGRRAQVHRLHPRRRGRGAAVQLPRVRHAQRGEPAADRRGGPEDERVYPTEDAMARMSVLEDVLEATTLYDQVWTRVKAGQ